MTGRSTGKRGKAKSGPKEDKSVGTGDLGEISFGLVGQNGSHICTYRLTEEAQCRGSRRSSPRAHGNNNKSSHDPYHCLGALNPFCMSSYFILTAALWGRDCFPPFNDMESNLKEVKSFILDHMSSQPSESEFEPRRVCCT